MELRPDQLALVLGIAMFICMGPFIMMALAVYQVIRDKKRDESPQE